MEDILLEAACAESSDDKFSNVTKFYGDDLDPDQLRTQLSLLSSQVPSTCSLKDIIQYLRVFSPDERQVLSQVVKLVKLILVNPATNALSERSFSALRRIKTYLRSTMHQSRLNAVMCLHVHKERTDQISMLNTANAFVDASTSDHRKTIFGTFTQSDMH